MKDTTQNLDRAVFSRNLLTQLWLAEGLIFGDHTYSSNFNDCLKIALRYRLLKLRNNAIEPMNIDQYGANGCVYRNTVTSSPERETVSTRAYNRTTVWSLPSVLHTSLRAVRTLEQPHKHPLYLDVRSRAPFPSLFPVGLSRHGRSAGQPTILCRFGVIEDGAGGSQQNQL